MVEKETLELIRTTNPSDRHRVRMESPTNPYFRERFAHLVRRPRVHAMLRTGSHTGPYDFLRQLFCDAWMQKTLATQLASRNTKRIAAGTWSPHRTIRFDTDRYPVIGEVHVAVPGNLGGSS